MRCVGIAALVVACWLSRDAESARVFAQQQQHKSARHLNSPLRDDSPCALSANSYHRDCVFVSSTSGSIYNGKRLLAAENLAPPPQGPMKPESPTTISTTKSSKSNTIVRKAVINVSSREISHLESMAISFEIPGPPRMDDWVGAYCVDDETRPSPDIEFLDSVKTNNRSSGVIEFKRLPNMRCSWQFRLFRVTETGQHMRLAHSPYVRMANGRFEPLQVHLAMTNTPTEMRVMWVSAPVNNPEVHYGDSPANLSLAAQATSSSYKASDMCEEPATIASDLYYRDPGALYDALMVGLTPGRTYYYQVGGYLKSKVFKFTVPLPAGSHDPNTTISFFVYGDMGDWDIKALGELPDDRTGATAELMRIDMDSAHEQNQQFVAAFHDGDISYAKGRTFLWDQFLALIQPVAAEIPYMIEVGNHDYCYLTVGSNDPSGATGSGFHPPDPPPDCGSGGECGVPLNKRFHMPDNGNNVFWYSVEMGLMHHTVISTEHDYTSGSPMYNWLVNDLKHVDRKKTPWLFLHIHRPMYCSEMYEKDYQLSQFIRKNLETLCANYGVDVVFSGHYHAYERTCPVFQEQCLVEKLGNGLEKAKAPVHIMVGSAGASLDNAGYYPVTWSRAAQMEYGYGRVHVYNATHALYEFKRNRDRSIADSTWIISDHDWQDEILAESFKASSALGKFAISGGANAADAWKHIELAVDTDEDLIADGIPPPQGDEPGGESALDQDLLIEEAV